VRADARAGLVRGGLAEFALQLDVHAHPSAAEVEDVIKSEESRRRRRPIMRDDHSAAGQDPHIRLDFVASEFERLLKRLDRVVRRVSLRAAMSDPPHDT